MSIYFIKFGDRFHEMFVRMLTVYCDQNNSYEITINGFQVRKINEIRMPDDFKYLETDFIVLWKFLTQEKEVS